MESDIDQVINLSWDEVMVALKHSSTNGPISTSQEKFCGIMNNLTHDSDGGDDYNSDDTDAWHVESTMDSDCFDFGSYVHHQDEFPDALFYNPYVHTTCLCQE